MYSTPKVAWLALRRLSHRITGAIAIAAASYHPAAAVDDVLLQTMAGKIVTGIVDDETSTGTIGAKIFRQQFLSNFRSANPGFFALATGNPNLSPGVAGFPSNHEVRFDLLPMSTGLVSSNLLYWDGSDLDGDGLDLEDVLFGKLTGVAWEVFDANFDMFAANATDQLVPGGLIQKTSSDIDPLDGIDTGSIHKHLALQLSDGDNNSSTSPAQGVYMIAWQARSANFETSAPFLFVHRTSLVADAVRDLAADWALANYNLLISPPMLPGDYNRNGSVDAADYVFWRDTLGQTGSGLLADGNGNDLIDAGDYDVWRANFGRSFVTFAANSSVPEPETSILLMAAVAGASCIATLRRNAKDN